MQENKEVATREKAGLPAEMNEAWGAETANVKNLLISKILLMQGLSSAVTDEKADQGQLMDSVTMEELGSGREKGYKKIPVIPLMGGESWVTYEMIDDQPNWIEEVPVSASNENWPREEEVEGRFLRHDRSLNYYVMLADQIKDPTAIPYIISFRRTSFRTGRALETHFLKCAKAARAGKPVPPAATTFELCAKKETKNDNTFWVFTIEASGQTEPDDLKACYEWYQVIKQGKHDVDTSEFTGEGTATEKEASSGEQREDF